VKLRAPIDAQTLMKKLGLSPRSRRSAILKELLQERTQRVNGQWTIES
jgi:hypothetical protein